MSTPSAYLDSAREGRNAWWTYALGLFTILFAWLIVGSVLTLIVFLLFSIPAGQGVSESLLNMTALLEALPAGQMFLVINISFVPLLVTIILVVWLIHRRSPRTLITPFARIDWRRMGLAFIVWTAVAGLASLTEFLIWPETFSFSFDPGRYIAFIALPLAFTPIQIAAEELFFRGYILQGMGLLTRNRPFLIVSSGVLFLLPHLANPELYLGDEALSNFAFTALAYLTMGSLLAWATLRDNTLEVALGTHAANNLYVVLLVNFEGSALPTPALVITTHYDALFNLAALVVGAGVFAALMFGVFTKRSAEAPA